MHKQIKAPPPAAAGGRHGKCSCALCPSLCCRSFGCLANSVHVRSLAILWYYQLLPLSAGTAATSSTTTHSGKPLQPLCQPMCANTCARRICPNVDALAGGKVPQVASDGDECESRLWSRAVRLRGNAQTNQGAAPRCCWRATRKVLLRSLPQSLLSVVWLPCELCACSEPGHPVVLPTLAVVSWNRRNLFHNNPFGKTAATSLPTHVCQHMCATHLPKRRCARGR